MNCASAAENVESGHTKYCAYLLDGKPCSCGWSAVERERPQAVTISQTPRDALARIAKHWPPLAAGIPALTQAEAATLLRLVEAADTLVAHIGAHGEINSRHSLTLDCLEALIAADPK